MRPLLRHCDLRLRVADRGFFLFGTGIYSPI
jgi:hypothetical protein